MAGVVRFEVPEVNETQALTGAGAFASGKYTSFKAPEVEQGGINLQKSGPAVSTTPGGP